MYVDFLSGPILKCHKSNIMITDEWIEDEEEMMDACIEDEEQMTDECIEDEEHMTDKCIKARSK